MAIRQLESPKFKAVYGAAATSGTPGEALDSGRIFVTTTGGTYTNADDRAQVWDDKAKTTETTRDADGAIALDSSGEVELWFDDTVDIRVESSSEELQYTLVGIESSPSAVATGEFNLVQNGSFEVDTDGDGAPNSWTLNIETDATIAIDSAALGQTHGGNGLKFTAAGGGGGSAQSTRFNVQSTDHVEVEWAFKQSGAATATYSVRINWYKRNNDPSAVTVTTNLWNITSGAPTSFTGYHRVAQVPSDAVYAILVLVGLESNGAALTGECWFDHVQCYDKIESTIYDVDTPISVGTGTSITHTGIPAYVRRLTIILEDVSTDAVAGDLGLQIGDAGGIETTGYKSGVAKLHNGAAVVGNLSATTFLLAGTLDHIDGQINGTITLTNTTGNTWVLSSSLTEYLAATDSNLNVGNGSKTLTATLTQFKLLLSADNFDAGQYTVIYD